MQDSEDCHMAAHLGATDLSLSDNSEHREEQLGLQALLGSVPNSTLVDLTSVA